MMKQSLINFISIIILIKISRCSSIENQRFPDNFKIGTASAAYQVEGAWNYSDKGENIWDFWTHEHPEYIADYSNGNVASDSYNKYTEDVQLLKKLGVDFYRLSISWTRILPNGFANRISMDGIRYYKNLINELLMNGIEPVVTIYHFDHPEIFEKMGGWTNELMVDWYVDYARIVIKEFGHLINTFITINEPTIQCRYGYNDTLLAPGKKLENVGLYLCVHNTLKAHAKVYHMYNDEYRSIQKGQIGILNDCFEWVKEEDTTDESIEQFFQFDCGWFMNPIYNGDYPEIMKNRIDKISKLEGRSSSRLPKFSRELIEYIRGTSDFFGLNHYSSVIPVFDPAEKNGVYKTDSGIISKINPSWPTTGSSLFYVVPDGFINILKMIKDKYNNPPVYIFENGYSDGGELNDYNRIKFHYEYISKLFEAIEKYRCNILGYTIWSFLDSFEWSSGYSIRFGIYKIDFESENRTRTPRLSASWWEEVIRRRELRPVPRI